MNTAELGTDILREVSRSFYLTLKLLPSEFRGPLSLGYLLARLSDTIADAGSIDLARRQVLLEQFRSLLSGPARRSDIQKFACALPGELEGSGLERGEWDLVLRAADCFDWLDMMDRKVGSHIRKVVGIIAGGQSWDLQRFAGDSVVRLGEDDELEAYAYQVAGCVGEFWTEIGFTCSDRFAREDRATLLRWGANYGKGLQLVNILRDVPEDLARGRCYLPGRGSVEAEVLGAELPRWQIRARELLADGLRYTAALHGSRLRMSTGLPALLGGRTLDRLENASWEDLEMRVKISRGEVKRSLWGAYVRSASWLPGSWKGEYRRACQRLAS
ncbi:MAG: squalene/phytoene synthase family protein [Verrucomicrobiota bacterium]|nr:squalene/phytoene synthase family protein [Verrucomicrobiota bacterium]